MSDTPTGLRNITTPVELLLREQLPQTDVQRAPAEYFRFDFERCVIPDLVGLSGIEGPARAGVAVSTTAEILTDGFFAKRLAPKALFLWRAYVVEDRTAFVTWRGVTHTARLWAYRHAEIQEGVVIVQWLLVDRHPLEALALEAPRLLPSAPDSTSPGSNAGLVPF